VKTRIRHVAAREILDSRGHPTLEVQVELEGGERGKAAVPSGASTGSHEARELRDGDARRYRGRGMMQAVAAVQGELARAVKGRDAGEQRGLDDALRAADGTPLKERLGPTPCWAYRWRQQEPPPGPGVCPCIATSPSWPGTRGRKWCCPCPCST